MIRCWQTQDIPEILDAWYTASMLAHPFLNDAFMRQEREDIEHLFLPQSETWVYVNHQKVLGFMSLLEYEVGGLFVHASAQRHGIGTALLNWALKTRSYLELEVFADNDIGKQFYQHFGFVKVGEVLHEESQHMQWRLRYSKNCNEVKA